MNDGLGNSNKLLTRLLLAGTERMGLRLASFDGGNLRNAIPREAHAVFGVPAGQADEMRRLTGQFAATFAEEYKYTDARRPAGGVEAGKPATVIDAGTALCSPCKAWPAACRHGRSMPGLMEPHQPRIGQVRRRRAHRRDLLAAFLGGERQGRCRSLRRSGLPAGRCRSRARRRLSGLEPRPVEQAAPSGGDGLRTPVRHAAQSTRHPRGTGVRSLPRKISEARNDIGR
ncbi:MAG: peptidase dimerization domain-containing protein, partial [Alistipes inops]